jgi:predicted RNA-binding protein with RPS1 domain
LLHVTDISWSRINHPSEVLSFGQDVKVMVIKFNEETKRISLGMKQLDANPWENITEEFPIGKVMSGKITNIADYGVFIELKDGRFACYGTNGQLYVTQTSALTPGVVPDWAIVPSSEARNLIQLKDGRFAAYGANVPVSELYLTTQTESITVELILKEIKNK